MKYIVTYASAGCLPDNEPREFESLEDAREYIINQWSESAEDANEYAHSVGREVPCTFGAVAWALNAIRKMQPGSHADDPRPGSLYRWTLEEA